MNFLRNLQSTMSGTLSKRQISTSNIFVDPIGFGTMGLAAFYGETAKQETVNALLDECSGRGGVMVDTADAYSPMSYGKLGYGEKQIGEYLRLRPEAIGKLFISTKFGFTLTNEGLVLRGDRDYVHSACQASLERLGLNHLDLYYAHRPNLNCSIEETIGAMKELKEQGKIRFVGVSEYNVEQLEKANRIVKIDALQIELSPWTPEVLTNGILEWCEKNGTTLVAYSPLGLGFLSGAFKSPNDFESDDVRRMHPRFSEENFQKNLELVSLIKDIADTKSVTTSQIALAWVLAKSKNIIPIPGTKKLGNLKGNFSAETVTLTDSELSKIDKIIDSFDVGGPRYGDVPWKGTAF